MNVIGLGALQMAQDQQAAAQNAYNAPQQKEPSLIHIRIERMVNGYIVDVGEGHTGSEYTGLSVSNRGPRHLVTSRDALIELLRDIAPTTLDKPATSAWSGQPIEEKKW